ncbi:glutathione S-transferase [Inquilinus ginsengisoli]|uniref:glutathione transferase n=1 Tax=Inquilinus ginsengisoli TaxID=363840 RepID=A0ABU1JGL3_9PROT|nr:glutathione S-transferase family protein [Inquilinus ginsengisoli]MDR6287696.1 glutathione S-transferase [Inquilinus ginsengisoli]
MSPRPILYGARYSAYVRTALMVLQEKGVAFDLVEVDIFAPGGPPPDHLPRHPFGRIPAFEHDGFALYETAAITRYVDEAFDGPALQPADARGRARLTQIIGILDAYAYRPLVWDIYVERVSKPATGSPADESLIANALPRAELCLDVLAGFLGDGPWLLGDAISLADLHAAPILDYFKMAPEGRALMAGRNRLEAWWDRLTARPSATVLGPE